MASKDDKPVLETGTDEELESSLEVDPANEGQDDDALPTAPVTKGDEELRMDAIAAQTAQSYLPPSTAEYTVPTVDKKVAESHKKHIARFAKLARVPVSDVIAFNPRTLTGVTKAGGKYQMNRKGSQIRILAGPAPDGMVTDQELRRQEMLEKEANAEA